MKHLYIPLFPYGKLEMETNWILRATGSPVRYARFRHISRPYQRYTHPPYVIEVWYPPNTEDSG